MSTVTKRRRERQNTTAGWSASTTPLLLGELGVDTDTGQVKVGDGSTLWAGLDAIAGSDGPQGPPGGTGLVGTLAERPTSTGDGTLYTATDVDGGTLYTRAAGVWRQSTLGVSVAQSGSVLTAAVPASVAAVSATTGGVQVPELTTAAVSMPASGRLWARVPSLAVQGGATGGLKVALRYRVNGGSWLVACNVDPTAHVSGVLYSVMPLEVPVPPATKAAVAAGASVEVAVFLATTSGTQSRQVFVLDNATAPFLAVVAG